MECTGCGKNLSTNEMRGENCPYCETALPHQKDAIAQAAAVKELLRDSDGDGVPDVLEGTHLDPRNRKMSIGGLGPESLPSQRKTVEYKKKSGGVGGCLGGILALLIIGGLGATMYALEQQEKAEAEVEAEPTTETHSSNISVHLSPGTTTITTSSGGAASGPAGGKRPRHVYDVCLLDANGDSVSDCLARTGSGKSPVIQILDGTSGQPLWASKPYDTQVDIACIDEHWFVVATPSFQLDFYHSRQLGPPVRVKASDRLRAIQMGDGCVSFKTDDRKKAGVALPSGMAQKCPTTGRMPRLTDSVPGIMALTEHRTRATADGTTYTLTHRRNGTPMLIVTAKRDKKTLWEKELSVRKPTFSAAIAVGDGVVAVVGSIVPDRDRAVLVGLKAEDGSPLYEVPLAERQTDHMDFMRFNGHAVVMQHGVVLQGRDIKTGQALWRIGD